MNQKKIQLRDTTLKLLERFSYKQGAKNYFYRNGCHIYFNLFKTPCFICLLSPNVRGYDEQVHKHVVRQLLDLGFFMMFNPLYGEA